MSTAHWPQIGCGAIVRRDDSVLLVKRGREPRKGQWAIPGGRVHAGETLHQATEREVLEETGITIRAREMVYQLEYIEHDDEGEIAFHYVVLDYAGEYISGEPLAGDDADETAWVPFNALADMTLSDSTRDALHTLFPREYPR